MGLTTNSPTKPRTEAHEATCEAYATILQKHVQSISTKTSEISIRIFKRSHARAKCFNVRPPYLSHFLWISVAFDEGTLDARLEEDVNCLSFLFLQKDMGLMIHNPDTFHGL